MDRPTPPSQDDQLLERLRALGPVLDDLTDEASGNGAPSADAQGRLRTPDRGRKLAAAAVVLLVIGAIGLVALVSRDDTTVRARQPETTTTTQTDAAPEALVAERIDALEQCGPLPTREQVPAPWPEDWQMVGSPACDTAYVEDPQGATEPVPVFVEPEVTTPIAYWSTATGWIDATEYDDPAFDLDRYRAAYRAELETRGEANGD